MCHNTDGVAISKLYCVGLFPSAEKVDLNGIKEQSLRLEGPLEPSRYFTSRDNCRLPPRELMPRAANNSKIKREGMRWRNGSCWQWGRRALHLSPPLSLAWQCSYGHIPLLTETKHVVCQYCSACFTINNLFSLYHKPVSMHWYHPYFIGGELRHKVGTEFVQLEAVKAGFKCRQPGPTACAQKHYPAHASVQTCGSPLLLLFPVFARKPMWGAKGSLPARVTWAICLKIRVLDPGLRCSHLHLITSSWRTIQQIFQTRNQKIIWIWVPTPLFMSFITLEKSPELSGVRFPHL